MLCFMVKKKKKESLPMMTGRFSFMHIACFNSRKESESLMAELFTPGASEQHYVQAGREQFSFNDNGAAGKAG